MDHGSPIFKRVFSCFIQQLLLMSFSTTVTRVHKQICFEFEFPEQIKNHWQLLGVHLERHAQSI